MYHTITANHTTNPIHKERLDPIECSARVEIATLYGPLAAWRAYVQRCLTKLAHADDEVEYEYWSDCVRFGDNQVMYYTAMEKDDE